MINRNIYSLKLGNRQKVRQLKVNYTFNKDIQIKIYRIDNRKIDSLKLGDRKRDRQLKVR